MLNLAPIDQREDLATKGYVDDAVGAVKATFGLSVSSNLSSAGWYRAVVYNAYDSYSAQGTSGEIVDINIVWTATNNCGHHIKLFLDYGKVAFLGEESHGSYNIVDMIRYAHNGSVGYIDIHFAGLSSGNIPVHFAFDVTARSYAAPNWIPGNLEPVADAPAGETVVTTHNFQSNNTLMQISSAPVSLFNCSGSISPSTISFAYNSEKTILQLSAAVTLTITSRDGANLGFKFNLPFAYNGPTINVYVGFQTKYTDEGVYMTLANGSSEVMCKTTESYHNMTTGAVRFYILQTTIYMN